MLELDINKIKNLDFEVQLSGIDSKQLEGWLRILVDGTEYGFKADVTPTNVIVNVPELKDVVLREFREGEELNGKLELQGGGFYFNPWNGLFVVKNPVCVEVKIKEDIEIPRVSAKARAKLNVKSESKLPEPKKVVYESVDKRKDGSLEKKAPVIEKKVSKPKLNVVITEKHIIAYMKTKGTTSKDVQELILERCKAASKSDKSIDLLRAVVNFYKNKGEMISK